VRVNHDCEHAKMAKPIEMPYGGVPGMLNEAKVSRLKPQTKGKINKVNNM